MPIAQNNDFCPQCGCHDSTHIKDEGIKAHLASFTCGEVVTLYTSKVGSAEGVWETSYTCNTIAQKIPLLERALVSAVRVTITKNRFGRRTIELLDTLSKAPVPRVIGPDTLVVRRLLADEMVVEGPKGQVTITPWGLMVSAKLNKGINL